MFEISFRRYDEKYLLWQQKGDEKTKLPKWIIIGIFPSYGSAKAFSKGVKQ